MTAWLEVAERYKGLAEDTRPGKSNAIILGWLQNEGGGKSWVKNDSTPWCGAYMAAVMSESGLSHVIPKSPLAARSWRECGVPLKEPRKGAIAVFSRGSNPAHGHVGFWLGEEGKDVVLLGGNQSNKVSVARYPKSRLLELRWPVPLKTPKEIEGESRIAAAAARQQKDALKGTTAGSTAPAPVVAPPPKSSVQQTVDGIVGDMTWVKSIATSIMDFLGFVGAGWPFIAAAVALYFFARMAWDSHLIKTWRTDDHNEGWTT